MATWVNPQSITSPFYSNCHYELEGGYGTVSRSGNTISFDFGIRLKRTTGAYTYNSIVIRYPDNSSGTIKYIQEDGQANLLTQNVTYYAANSYKVTSETLAWHYSGTVSSVAAGSVTVSVGLNDSYYTPNASSAGYITYSFSVPYPSGYTAPSWTTYVVNSFPSTAYANIPYIYNINLACSYGTSSGNNLLYWEGVKGSSTLAINSTTGTSISAGSKSYTFANGHIGSWTFRGVIRYTDANGSTAYMTGTTYPLTVSFLNPTLSGVSHSVGSANYYRTSTVTATSTFTSLSNSASPTVYTYFSSPSAEGDGSGTGYYQIASFGPDSANGFNGVTKSYTHPGTESGTFYTRLSLRGNNGSGTWTEFATYGQTSYTMQPFVTPTATRTVKYNKNNVYVGQTKFPVTVTVTAINKSQYDSLTPTFALGPRKNGNWSYDTTVSHAWATGTYNYTLSKTSNAYAAGDIASFCDEMTYKNVENANAYSQISSSNYTVKTIPTPTASNVSVSIAADTTNHTITGAITGTFDSDFKVLYTMYIESSDGEVVYQTYVGELNSSDMKQHVYKYDTELVEQYRVRVQCYYALSDETNVHGSTVEFVTESTDPQNIKKLMVKDGNGTYRFYLFKSCPTPRLMIKSGTEIYYLPLFAPYHFPTHRYLSRYTHKQLTNPDIWAIPEPEIEGGKHMLIKNGELIYHAIAEYLPAENTYRYLSLYTHKKLSEFTHKELNEDRII